MSMRAQGLEGGEAVAEGSNGGFHKVAHRG